MTALSILACMATIVATQQKLEQQLWYNSPAQAWEERLPLGNGRLGMMVDGGVEEEHIILNEISMWSG